MSGIKNYIMEAEKMDRDFSDIDRPMSGTEIAKKLGITRQAVSNTLKRSMAKAYQAMKKEDKTEPFETAVNMMIGLGINLNADKMEIKKFFKLFPPDIRKAIEMDAKKVMPGIK